MPGIGSKEELEHELSAHADAIKQLERQQGEFVRGIEQRIAAAHRAAYGSNGKYRGIFDTEDEARCFGLLVLCATAPDHRLREHAEQALERSFRHVTRGIDGDTALIPHEYSSLVKRLIERYGVFTRRATNVPMTSSTMSFIKQVGEVQVFGLRQGYQGEESGTGYRAINLTAKDYGSLTFYPREVEDDAIVPIGELVMKSIGYAFGRKIDQMAFTGDGTETSINNSGVVHLLKNINGEDDGGSLVLASGPAGGGWDGITLADFTKMMARLPDYEGPEGPAWYCSRTFYYQVVVPLLLASGGVTMKEIASGANKQLLGAPVEFANVLPRTGGNSQIPLLFGDLSAAATYGDRQQVSMEQSREFKFAQRQVTVLGTARFAINIDELGDADNAGPMIGLVTPSAA